MSGFVAWWQGKKTIVGGGLVMVAALAGLWLGYIDVTSALGVFGFGLSIAGMAAKSNRHQAQILTVLEGVAKAAADYRAGAAPIMLETDAAKTASNLLPFTLSMHLDDPSLQPGAPAGGK